MVLQGQDYETLKRLLLNGPTPQLDASVRGRLALYRLIDETPRGWRITTSGKAALRSAKVPSAVQSRPKQARDPDTPRNYKKRPRDMSWIE